MLPLPTAACALCLPACLPTMFYLLPILLCLFVVPVFVFEHLGRHGCVRHLQACLCPSWAWQLVPLL